MFKVVQHVSSLWRKRSKGTGMNSVSLSLSLSLSLNKREIEQPSKKAVIIAVANGLKNDEQISKSFEYDDSQETAYHMTVDWFCTNRYRTDMKHNSFRFLVLVNHVLLGKNVGRLFFTWDRSFVLFLTGVVVHSMTISSGVLYNIFFI